MSKRPQKVIISCALTGGIHTPTMSAALPVNPDMLAEQGRELCRMRAPEVQEAHRSGLSTVVASRSGSSNGRTRASSDLATTAGGPTIASAPSARNG
jgi:hypothetical protein